MPDLRLDSPVQFLKGVGPARAEVLAGLGIRTAGDLLFYFPRDLARRPAREPIEAVRSRAGQDVTLGGVLERARWGGRPYRPVFSARVADNTGAIDVVWFNASWLRDKLNEGDRVVLTGRLRRGSRGLEMNNPKFQILTGDDDPAPAEGEAWEPVYPAGAEITSNQLRSLLRRNLPRLLPLVVDPHDAGYLADRKLLDRRLAVGRLHFPAMPATPISLSAAELPLEPDLSAEEISARRAAARHRLAWDEALLFQLALAMRRRARQTQLAAPALPCDGRVRDRILSRFPFELTGAQRRAIDQIAADLAQQVPMNRLLQGDVGSGKTVVALFAALVAVANKCQAAIMAPTEILAAQHHDRIAQYLRGSRVRWAMLTGSLTAAARRDVHARLAAGDLDLVVGTTALLSEGVRFARLAVAVIDEQHKFGVYQRSDLRRHAGPAPHTLVMTATPIPRSLALTVFGDLAVSTLDELPPGRGRIDTRVATPANHAAAFDFIAQRLAAGGQAYVVCPRVSPTDDPDAEEDPAALTLSAERAFDRLKPRFSRFGMALVHGQMDRARQQAALADFAAGRVRVLVATTVIEVGVDVPAANIMAVLGAERFGLAQLHQLRGRIGRGEAERSYCLLLTDADDESAAARLGILEKTRDGFRIAEADLAQRGPGRMLGVAQHGQTEFRYIELVRDLPMIRAARREAFATIAADPTLAAPGRAILRRELMKTHGATMDLVDA
ncbi:MAG: ATP-dependent DNA helicase RecG [Phycisphaerae bacterium]|nr:ATP-dependent DNA helicase RecG [Phycisphaerae bacterium]